VLWVALWGGTTLLAGRAAAEEMRPPRRPRALTALEAGPYRHADLVAVGQVQQVTDIQAPGGARGRQVVFVRVERVFKGTAEPGEEISLLVLGQRPTLNPSRPSIPYFTKGRRDRFVLFLGRGAGQEAYSLQTLFDLKGKDAGDKIAAVKLVASSAAIEDREVKAGETLAALVKMMRGGGAWGKAFAARELNYFAHVRPEAIDARTRARLKRTPATLLTEDQRHGLREMFKTLAASRGGAGSGPAAIAPEDDPWRVFFRRATGETVRQKLLTRLLASGGPTLERQQNWVWQHMQPSLRAWWVGALSRAGRREQSVRLRAVYGSEADPRVREAIVRAVGILGSDKDVTWLAERVQNVQLFRVALLALARISSPAARRHLETARRGAERRGEQGLAAWLAYLLGPGFKRSEQRARRSG